MEERIQKLEQRVQFLERSFVDLLSTVSTNTRIDEEQTELIKRIICLIEEDRRAIKTLSRIKV